MSLRRLEVFVIVSIIAAIGIVYALTQKPVLAPETESQNQNQSQGIAVGEPNPSAPIEYQGQDGKTALELLKAGHTVDTKNYSFGELVTGIDGISPDASHFWALYVNDKISEVGASQYMTKSADRIKWVIEEVKN